MRCSISLSAVAGLAFASAAFGAPIYTPPTVTVNYGGTNYTISSQNINYTANTTALTSQPWWGNVALSTQLASLVKMQAGGYQGSSSQLGALFGYGTSGGYVSIVFWNQSSGGYPLNAAYNCPSACPALGTNYYYAYLVSMSSAVTLESVASSLVSTSSAADFAMSNANMLINGAHSRPLFRRVAAGEKTVWVAGDFGRDDHGVREGTTGLAEVGGGYNFGPVQVNLSVGKTKGTQDLVHGGRMDADGQYLMVEGIIPVIPARGIFATLGGYGHRGNFDIRRGYLNAGTQDFSTAKPDSTTWGARARLDWENAFELKSLGFSPYTDLSYSQSRMEGYTETDGGLPARFDSRTNRSTEIRAGVNAALPIANRLNIVANLEGAHRFNKSSSSTSGEVIGRFNFSLPGEDYKATWAKGGIGLEGELAKGKASLMLNATTSSSMPSAWVAATYQLSF